MGRFDTNVIRKVRGLDIAPTVNSKQKERSRCRVDMIRPGDVKRFIWWKCTSNGLR